MSGISQSDVATIAQLSRLKLSQEELSMYQKEIESILHYVEKLQAVDTQGLQPTYQGSDNRNVFRADEIIDYGTNPHELLKNSPDREGDYFKVDRMVG